MPYIFLFWPINITTIFLPVLPFVGNLSILTEFWNLYYWIFNTFKQINHKTGKHHIIDASLKSNIIRHMGFFLNFQSKFTYQNKRWREIQNLKSEILKLILKGLTWKFFYGSWENTVFLLVNIFLEQFCKLTYQHLLGWKVNLFPKNKTGYFLAEIGSF